MRRPVKEPRVNYLTTALACAFLLLTGFATPAGAMPNAADAIASGAIPNDPGWEKGRLLKGGLSDVESAEREAAGGHYAAAYKLFDLGFIAAETVPGRAYALRREAECQFRNGNYYKAQKSYKKLLENYAPFIPLEGVLETQRRLAALLASGEASPLGFRNNDLAAEVYETLLAVAPGGKNAPADMLRLAAIQTAGGKTAEAVESYRELTRRFPRSPECATARLALARLLLKQGRLGDGDGRYNNAARNEMLRFLAESPAAAQVSEARTLLAQANNNLAMRLVNLGKFYLRKYSYRPNTARRYFYDAVRLYPDTDAARLAQSYLDALPAGEGGVLTGTAQAPQVPEPPPEILKPLQIEEREKTEKWLLPLEIKDYSEYLDKSRAGRAPKPASGAAGK